MPDVCYRYDGSLDGMMCCIFESYRRDEMPVDIFPANAPQMSLFPTRQITTSPEKSRRVSQAIHQKISADALILSRLSFLTCLESREMHILRFVRLGFELGAKTASLVADPRVDVLRKAVSHLKGEQHLFKGFVRFSDVGGALVAQIEPKNFVLPLIAAHFAGRLSGENFLIYDKTHKAALIYSAGQKEIVKLDTFTMPAASGDERQYRRLWRQFYDRVAVEGRENPRCRMSHMPKRYWGTMTEFLDRDSPPELPPERARIAEKT